MRDKRRAKNSAAKERRMSVSSASKTKATNLLDGVLHDGEDEDAMLNELTERFEAATALSPGACTKAKSSTTAVMAKAQRLQTRWMVILSSISYLSVLPFYQPFFEQHPTVMFPRNMLIFDPHHHVFLQYPPTHLSPRLFIHTTNSSSHPTPLTHPILFPLSYSLGLALEYEVNVLSLIYSNIYVHEATTMMTTRLERPMD